MALGHIDTDTKRKIYLSIVHGKIAHYLTEGGVEYFSSVSGTVRDIYLKDRIFNGEKAPFWYIDIRDGLDLYAISFPYISGVFKSIILSLSSDEELTNKTPIVIQPYEKGNFTKVATYARGVKLDWVTKDLPPVKEHTQEGRKVQDDTERMKFITGLVGSIRKRLGK